MLSPAPRVHLLLELSSAALAQQRPELPLMLAAAVKLTVRQQEQQLQVVSKAMQHILCVGAAVNFCFVSD